GDRSLIQTRCLARAVCTPVLPRGQLAAFHRAEEGALPEGSDSFWKSSSSSKPSGIWCVRYVPPASSTRRSFRARSHYPRRNRVWLPPPLSWRTQGGGVCHILSLCFYIEEHKLYTIYMNESMMSCNETDRLPHAVAWERVLLDTH